MPILCLRMGFLNVRFSSNQNWIRTKGISKDDKLNSRITQNRGSSGNMVSFSSRPYFKPAHFPVLLTKANTRLQPSLPSFSPLQNPGSFSLNLSWLWSKTVSLLICRRCRHCGSAEAQTPLTWNVPLRCTHNTTRTCTCTLGISTTSHRAASHFVEGCSWSKSPTAKQVWNSSDQKFWAVSRREGFAEYQPVI